MGAQSVTGKGRGSADGKNKGSQHQTLGAAHLVGPRVMAAGRATLTDGAATVELPLLSGVAADYVVMTSDVTAANASYGAITLGAVNTALALTGTSTDVIVYAIIKKGNA